MAENKKDRRDLSQGFIFYVGKIGEMRRGILI